MKGLGDLMKQAAQMQEKMQTLQAEIAAMEVTGESGAGLVQVTMNGRHEVKRVHIDPSLLAEDKEILEDLIAAASTSASALPPERLCCSRCSTMRWAPLGPTPGRI